MPLVGQTLRMRAVAPRLLSAYLFEHKLFIFKPLIARQGREASGQSGSAWQPRGSGARRRRAEVRSATVPHNVPPRATLTGDPQRLCNTHLSPPLRRPASGAQTTTVPACATPARPAAWRPGAAWVRGEGTRSKTQPPQAHLPRSVHHEPPAHAPNAALMIDFDNVTMGIRSDLQSELRRLLQSDIIKGKVAVQRAYADWRRYPQYIVPLAESSIDMIWAPAYGSNKKNATDIRLAVDALELVFTRPEIGTFILLSGDSDFSSLVLKLKEYGKYVIGVGIRESSSDLLIQNCDEYYSYNELAGLTKESDVTHERHDPWDLVIEAVKQMTAHSDVMRSDRLKQVMQEIDPTFNEKDLGFSRFSKFVVEAAHKGLIALNKLDNGQYEIGLGPGVPGAAAQPAGVAAPATPATSDRSDRGRERGEGRGRGR